MLEVFSDGSLTLMTIRISIINQFNYVHFWFGISSMTLQKLCGYKIIRQQMELNEMII